MRTVIAIVAGLLALTTLGCGQGGFGGELVVKPKPLPLESRGSVATKVPQQAPFSITQFEAHRSSTAGGAADSSASATDQGTASATAEAGGGGKASSSFQLGHAFHNPTERQLAAEVVVSYDCEYSAAANPETGLPDATIGLELVVRNRRTRATRRVELASYTTEQGAGAEVTTKQFTVDVIFAPDEVYDIYLGGGANITTKPARHADCALKITNVEMQLSATAAPATRTADDEQN